MRARTVLFAAFALTILAAAHFFQAQAGSTQKMDELSRLEAMKSLPYSFYSIIDGDDQARNGVAIHNASRTYQGINLYNSRARNTAYLMGMNGNILHNWSINLSSDGWQLVEPDGEANIYVIAKDQQLVKLDWDSNIVWKLKGRFHHDLAVAGNGDIYALSRDAKRITQRDKELKILDDKITIITPDGKVKGEYSVYDIVGHMIPAETLDSARYFYRLLNNTQPYIKPNTRLDVLHTNTIEILGHDIEGVAKAGDLLLSFRDIDTIAIVDARGFNVSWSWGEGILGAPHQPTLLSTGNILVFDNGPGRNYSRVLEVDPRTGQVVWNYNMTPLKDFFSKTMGGNQGLPNGNTLITESEKGHAFEVTADGEIVWEFSNPDTRMTGNTTNRTSIYRMRRLTPDEISRLPLTRFNNGRTQ